jgi:hypothetical protein
MILLQPTGQVRSGQVSLIILTNCQLKFLVTVNSIFFFDLTVYIKQQDSIDLAEKWFFFFL